MCCISSLIIAARTLVSGEFNSLRLWERSFKYLPAPAYKSSSWSDPYSDESSRPLILKLIEPLARLLLTCLFDFLIGEILLDPKLSLFFWVRLKLFEPEKFDEYALSILPLEYFFVGLLHFFSNILFYIPSLDLFFLCWEFRDDLLGLD